MVQLRRQCWRYAVVVLTSLGIIVVEGQASVSASDLIIEHTKPQRSVPRHYQYHQAQPNPKAFGQMTWIGAQITGKDWAIYSGTSTALSGSINDAGWRMRVIAGYSSYSYSSMRRIRGQSMGVTYQGENGFGDVWLGYQWQTGDLTLKMFAGVNAVGHIVTPFDPENSTIGNRYGGSAALEAWFSLSDRLWLSTDTKYATASDSFHITLTAGYRVWPKFSLGIAVNGSGNEDHQAARMAGVAAAELGLFEANDSYLRFSAGVSADRDMELNPYTAVSFTLKY